MTKTTKPKKTDVKTAQKVRSKASEIKDKKIPVGHRNDSHREDFERLLDDAVLGVTRK